MTWAGADIKGSALNAMILVRTGLLREEQRTLKPNPQAPNPRICSGTDAVI